jgi:hypothetical protein
MVISEQKLNFPSTSEKGHPTVIDHSWLILANFHVQKSRSLNTETAALVLRYKYFGSAVILYDTV